MSSTGPAGAHGPSGKPPGAQPSQLHGHMQYVKGTAEELIGKVTGSDSWKASGRADVVSGVSEMRAARESSNTDVKVPIDSTSHSATTVVGGGNTSRRDTGDDNLDALARQGPIGGPTGLGVEGKVEGMFGKVVGCKGMQEEGAEKVAAAEKLNKEH